MSKFNFLRLLRSGNATLSCVWQYSRYTRQMSNVRRKCNTATEEERKTMIKQVFKWIKKEPKHADMPDPESSEAHTETSKER